jgi:hypothetical protein
MMDFIKQWLSNKERQNELVEMLTLNDLPPCEFLNLAIDEQNNQLVKDGHFEYKKMAGTTISPDQFGQVDPRMEGTGLPMMTSDIKVYISLQEDDLIEAYTVKESVLSTMFDFFVSSLSEIINAEKYSLNHQLSNYLSQVEEADKRKYARGFFNDVFQTFNYEKIALNEPNHTLPLGVESTNLLSKLWMYESYFKQHIFKEERELILRYLYGKDSLQVTNIHAYHELLGELVRFIARKEVMLEVNEKYHFEQNHPYTFIHSNGLVFENHSSLFANEIDFNWTIDLLISLQDQGPIQPKFYHRLADALFQEDAFLLSSPFTEFKNLINSGFCETLTRIRPSENTSDDAKKEIEQLKISLNQYRKEKSK